MPGYCLACSEASASGNVYQMCKRKQPVKVKAKPGEKYAILLTTKRQKGIAPTDGKLINNLHVKLSCKPIFQA